MSFAKRFVESMLWPRRSCPPRDLKHEQSRAGLPEGRLDPEQQKLKALFGLNTKTNAANLCNDLKAPVKLGDSCNHIAFGGFHCSAGQHCLCS
mmetsp:Transcript_147567/g.282870  ORF Transcript_147567/g.282870 Transcript_147567/m.282870 type:complete len:93 (-) Transcript_147567:41-319(-)